MQPIKIHLGALSGPWATEQNRGGRETVTAWESLEKAEKEGEVAGDVGEPPLVPEKEEPLGKNCKNRIGKRG